MTAVGWASGGVSGVVEDGRAGRSCLLIRKGLAGVPQFVVGGGGLTGILGRDRMKGGVVLEARRGRLAVGASSGVASPAWTVGEPGALGVLLAGDGWPGHGPPGRSGSGCPGLRASWSRAAPLATSPSECAGPTPAHEAC